MKSVEPESHNEIIIVRRGGNDDDGEHHGGAWEVAYADFMTSMMAFFLVMWLINAANDETKAAVASYFNPIKLVDRRTNPRGIQDNNAVGDNDEKKGSDSHDDQTDTSDTKPENSSEQQKLMNGPYEELDKIANPKKRPQGAGGSSDGGSQKGASQGTAYRDPFSPDYWSQNASTDISGVEGGPNQHSASADNHALTPAEAQAQAMLDGENGKPVEVADTRSKTETPPETANKDAAKEESTKQSKSVDIAGKDKKTSNADNAVTDETTGKQDGDAHQNADKAQEQPKSETPQEAAKDNSLPAEIREISGELSKLVKDTKDNNQPMVRIVHVKDGVAIELMDQINYGMFSVGSAKPDKKTVDLLAGIAKILQTKNGDVVISGHTDSRPYKSATYDNWQLSSSRAQMAYYMLVRGGLNEKRVLRVEGYADHQLKNPKDPYAAENRRIEIFMRLPQSQSTPTSTDTDKSEKKL